MLHYQCGIYVDSILFFLLTEPIIKPVAKKKFFHAEQDLPATNYDVEYVQFLHVFWHWKSKLFH